MSRVRIRELTMFVVLVAVAVLGRWQEPMWNFTPLAAVAAFGGYYFLRLWVALLLPIVAVGTSHLLLPGYGDWTILGAVLAMLTMPAFLGRFAQRKSSCQQGLLAALCGLAPATAFFIVTNFFVWAFTSMYAPNLAGLIACYSAGIPFYRAMLLGDIFYVTLFVACICVVRTATVGQVPRGSHLH